jgi:hypothetical protein
MHTLQSIISRLTTIEHILTGLGYAAVDTDLNVHWTTGTPLRLRVEYLAGSEYLSEIFDAPEETDAALSAILEAAEAWAKNLPTPEERARHAFLLEFGRTIDKARDLGLPVEFLNPLEESMRKLSENILPAPRAGS